MHKLKVLICDDMEHVRIAHEHHLHSLGGSVFRSSTELATHPLEAIKLVKLAQDAGTPFDLALLDVDYRNADGACDADGLDGFWAANEIHLISPSTVIVMISSYGSEDNFSLAEKSPFVERFLRRGEFARSELLSICQFALVQKLHRAESLLPREDVAYTVSPVMEKYLRQADKVAAGDSVFIYGETGTGKELTAKRLNANARIILGQPSRPLVTINCGGMSQTLLNTELFGYMKGAFTGANADTPGLFEKADGGDIFLDELQNASPLFQDTLMRVLNDKQFTRVGGTTPKRLNVRFIAALNRSPTEAKRSGALKGDLVSRLQQGYLVIPPLRERKGDIPALIERFKTLAGQADVTFSNDAVQFLEESSWPTNVRGLRNVVRAAIQDTKIPLITAQALKRLPLMAEMLAEASSAIPTNDADSVSTVSGLGREVDALVQRWFASDAAIDEPIKSFERLVLSRLWESDPSVARVARRVKLPETTLRRKLTEYGIGSAASSRA